MKKVLRFAVLMSLVFGFAAVTATAFAQGEAVKAQAVSVTGELTAVDAVTSSLTIKVADDKDATKSSSLVVTVAPTAKIAKGETVETIADLKAGNKLTVTYTVNEAGNKIADSITVNG